MHRIQHAQGAGLPFEIGLTRNHYVGRTFIEPEQSIRHFGVKLKLNAVPEVLVGKRVVVVDDSIVRGTTSRKIIKMIRQPKNLSAFPNTEVEILMDFDLCVWES